MEKKRYSLGKLNELFKNYGSYPINKLVEADWNYKENDEDREIKLMNNIKQNGQVENLIIRELDTGFYEVVNGNHRLRIMQRLDQDEVFCYNMGKITDSQAKRIAIETNETKFDTDNIKLAQLIKDISVDFTFDDLAITMPYSQDELNDFSNLLEFDWDNFESTPKEKDAEREEIERQSRRCPKCGYEFDA